MLNGSVVEVRKEEEDTNDDDLEAGMGCAKGEGATGAAAPFDMRAKEEVEDAEG